MTISKAGFAKFSDFIGFERLIAPYLIKLIYWVGAIVIIVAGLAGFFGAFAATGGGIGRALLALIGMVFLLLIWRVVSELWILAFNIHERLGEIRDALSRQR